MGNFKSELKGLEKFQPIPRDLIQDCGLSAQARFIYAYMAAKPEGWEFWQDVMSHEVGMSVDTLRKYLYELRDAGWLEIGKQGSKSKGRFGATQYTLKALPCTNFSDTENFRHGEKPTREISDTENFRHLNNIDTKEKIDTKKEKESNSPALTFPFDSERFRTKWEDLLQNWKECLEPKELRKKTPRALQSLLKNLGKYHEDFAIELMERCIEGGWRGVVFKDTDAKYQEWKSARQQALDNAQPRTATAQNRHKIPDNTQVSAAYAEIEKKRKEEERQMHEYLKEKYGDAYNPSGS